MPAMETRFHVSETDLATYRAAIGMTGDAVPSGFLMRLLADETVLTWLRGFFGMRIPIHIKQSCEIFTPLLPGHSYELALSCADPALAMPVLDMKASLAGKPALHLAITFALIEAKR